MVNMRAMTPFKRQIKQIKPYIQGHKSFIVTLAVITLIYIVWSVIIALSSEQPDAGSAPSKMSYSDLEAAYSKLQEQLQTADSTHIIRRYHGRHALFSAQDVFDDEVMALSRQHFTSGKSQNTLYLDLPDFEWERSDDARPVDVMRLTYRGNGIPDNVERLAHSGLLEPKLHEFYTALIQQNTTLWVNEDASISFDVRTNQGITYKAKSTPFIAIQRLSKDHLAKMKAASLPFLWDAYVDEDAQRADQRALLAEPHGPNDLIGPYLPAELMPKPHELPDFIGPHYPRTQEEVLRSHLDLAPTPETYGPFYPALGAGSVLEALPGIADAMNDVQLGNSQQLTDIDQPSVSSFNMDEKRVEELFEDSLLNQSKSLTETLELKKAINNKRLKADERAKLIDQYLGRLARLDPEFMTLFLVNNLFEQYNIFSVFKDNVYLTVNALDTRLNVLYVSYNLRFDPPRVLDLDESLEAGCDGLPVQISDEFFLIAAKPHSYLIRVYLPSCRLNGAQYDMIDEFLSRIRILH